MRNVSGEYGLVGGKMKGVLWAQVVWEVEKGMSC